MPFYTYILQSQKDNTFYIGYTSNLEQRLFKHNNANSGYTARKKPWNIVYFEEFSTKTQAIKRELFLKKMRNKDFYIQLIESFKQ